MSPLITSNGEELMVGLLAVETEEDEPSPPSGRLLGLEPVRASDLVLARDETWFAGFAQGVLTADLGEHEWQVFPGESSGRDRVKGYFVDVRCGRKSYRRQFATATLAAVARRGAVRLRDQQVLGDEAQYSFFLTTRPAEEESPGAGAAAPLHAQRVSDKLMLDVAPLAELMERSDVYVGPTRQAGACPADKAPDETMQVFCPRDIWEHAREMSRLGGENESAAVLLGSLARDVESPAVFLQISECLRAEHAVEEKFAVGFSGATWGETLERLEQRRRRLKRPQEMIVGTAHGHNFKPSPDATGRMTCDACAVLEVCSRSTAHASDDDQRFHQSVFTCAPWAVLLLWGWNAREEEEWRLYGLKDAALSPRSVRILRE